MNDIRSFLDVEVSRERNKFATIVYRKPTFSGVYMYFDSFLPTTYKFGIIYALVFSCFSICSNQNNFHNELVYMKDIFLKNVYKFQCGRCNACYYGETDRILKVRLGEDIGISLLTFKKVKLSAKSSICDHLLFCNNDPLFDYFTIRAQGTNKFLLEIKESLLIKRDKPILNKNISSVLLFLFDKV